MTTGRNRVVARYQDGRVLKGTTNDFVADREAFHVIAADAPAGTKPTRVSLSELKAVFFVRDLAGRPDRRKSNEFDAQKPAIGRKVHVTFKDGEVMAGSTQAYQPGRSGFFMIPADAGSNTERCYVIAAAAAQITLL
jgi:hypothetical protein